MSKLVMVGRCFKGRKTTVVDLQTYREMKQGMKGKGSNQRYQNTQPAANSQETIGEAAQKGDSHDTVPESRKKKK